MREHELIIAKNEEDGVKVYLNAALDQLYADLFRKAKRSVRRDPWSVENGIRGVIFGCFLVEARSNSVLRDLLRKEIERSVLASSVWENTKRSSIIDKMKMLAPFASERVRARASDLFPRVRHTFDLRNRLAHFKDKNVLLGEMEEPEDLVDFVNESPRPEVLAELELPRIEKHLSALTDAKLWIGYVYKRHFKVGDELTA